MACTPSRKNASKSGKSPNLRPVFHGPDSFLSQKIYNAAKAPVLTYPCQLQLSSMFALLRNGATPFQTFYVKDPTRKQVSSWLPLPP